MWYYRSYLRYLKKHSEAFRFRTWRWLFFPTFTIGLMWSLCIDALRLPMSRGDRRAMLNSKIDTRWALLTRSLPQLARELI